MEQHDKASIEHDIGKTMTFSQVFPSTGTFTAVNAAETWLAKHGYSYGSMQQEAPIGIAKNVGRISKWYNMTTEDHRQLDGAMVSDDFRDGSVTVYLDRAPRGLSSHAPRAEHVAAPRAHVAASQAPIFPYGARVLIDGKYPAIVRDAFNKGSTSYLFPHYKVDFVDGDKNTVVAMTRVGVAHAPHAPRAPRKPSGKTTLATAKKELAALGMSLRKSDGEYRVTFRGVKPGRAEDVAHYTDDIDDAVATGRSMSKERSKV